MSISGKQVRQLRSAAHHLEPALIIGKNGITPATIKQISDSLEAHELVKVAIGDGCLMDAREVSFELADQLEAEIIQVIGHRIVLYRESSRSDVEHYQLG